MTNNIIYLCSFPNGKCYIGKAMKNVIPLSGDKHPKPQLGKKRSEEVKRKISETMKKKGLNPQMWRKS